jgi:hypothetical protein
MVISVSVGGISIGEGVMGMGVGFSGASVGGVVSVGITPTVEGISDGDISVVVGWHAQRMRKRIKVVTRLMALASV